ncbi:MAG TPA: hypothetical protein DHV14_09870 [Micrococcales bacterium]|nr:hypothetical protein [Micrococcales bacterium]
MTGVDGAAALRDRGRTLDGEGPARGLVSARGLAPEGRAGGEVVKAPALLRPDPRRSLDTRLVLPAAAAWATAALAVGWSGSARAVAALALLAVAIAALVRAVRAGRGRHRTRWPRGPTALLATAVLALCVLGSMAAQDTVRHGPAVTAGLDWGGTVTALLRTESEPQPTTTQRDGSPRLRLDATLLEVDVRGEARRARSPVVVLAGARWASLPPGSTVSASVRLVPTADGERAVALVLASGDPDVRAPPPSWRAGIVALRDGLRSAVEGLPPHARGLLPGIAVGDDSAVPPALVDAMRAAGLTHLLAVSGAHVAIVVGLVLIGTAGVPRAVRLGVSAVVLAGLVLLVGAEPSVVRAGAMGLVAMLALGLGRRSAAVPALAVAGAVLVLTDPWLARSPGFALSVLATAGIVLWSRPWGEAMAARLGRFAPVAPALAVPLAAQVACLPVLVGLDGGLATYAVLANALVAPVVPPVTVLALLATLVQPVAPLVAHGLLVVAQSGTWWIEAVATRAAALPLARLPWPGGAGGTVLTVGLGAGVWLLVRRGGLSAAAQARLRVWAAPSVLGVLSLVVVLSVLPATRGLVGRIALGSVPAAVPADWRLLQCDVGQGSALLVSAEPDGGPGAAVLVDTGPAGAPVRDCLEAGGVRELAALVLTHADADHVGELGDVLAAVPVRQALVPRALDPRLVRVVGALEEADVPVVAADADTPTLGLGALEVSVLWPTPRAVALRAPPEGDVIGSGEGGLIGGGAVGVVAGSTTGTTAAVGSDEAASSEEEAEGTANELSLSLWISAPELTVLAHGDAGAWAQAGIARQWPALPRPDVLVVAHHGSRDQDEALLSATAGRVSLVSVGAGNDYGHPADDVVARLSQIGMVARTDLCGRISVSARTDGALVVTGCP